MGRTESRRPRGPAAARRGPRASEASGGSGASGDAEFASGTEIAGGTEIGSGAEIASGTEFAGGRGARPARRLFRNAAVLLVGDVGGSVLSLASLTLTARSLGPGPFGVLVLIQTYVAITRGLVKFQPYQPLIRYGAAALQSGRSGELKSLIKFHFLLDLGSGVAGTALALTALAWIAPWKGWDGGVVGMAAVYSMVAVFHLSGTAIGVLRLFDRFGVTAAHRTCVATVKLLGVGVAALAGAGPWPFLLVWAGAEVLDGLLMLALGWRELRRRGLTGIARSRVRGIGRRHSGLWSFVWTTNLNGMSWTVANELDLLIVGGLAGATGAGLYKVAKQFGGILLRLSDPLYQAIYPELARIWTRGDRQRFVRMIVGTGSVAGCAAVLFWLAFLAFGGVALEWTVGAEYLAARPTLNWYLLAMAIAVGSLPLQPAMLAMGYPKVTLCVRVSAMLVYLPALYAAVAALGVVGAGIAYTLYYATWATAMSVIGWQRWSREEAPASVS